MKCRAFLFDFDGTVLNTDSLIENSWRCALNLLNVDVEQALQDVYSNYGKTLEEVVNIVADKYGVKDYDINTVHNHYWDYHYGHHHEIDGPYPSIREALEALKKAGALIGIVTSGEERSCRAEAEEFGISQYIDCIVGSEVDEPKPSPRPALLCCEKLGVSPKEAMLIGDSRHDMACGKRAGCTTAMVGWSQMRQLKLEGFEKPDIIIDDCMELLKYIL